MGVVQLGTTLVLMVLGMLGVMLALEEGCRRGFVVGNKMV